MRQRSIAKPFSATGIGLHSGREVTLEFSPSGCNSGIVFERTDLIDSPEIKVNAFAVQDTKLSSSLVTNDMRVGTVEHLLSAIAGLGIDNLRIGVSSAEVPIMDGSAATYIKLLSDVGIIEQEAHKKFIKVKQPVKVADDDKWAELLPFEGFQLNFEIDFDHPAFDKKYQQATFDFSTENFIYELSRARTFGFLKDIEYLRQNNLALGGSLDNAIVLDDTKILNQEGLRFADEFVKHKILDAIGDLYLAGLPLLAQFNAYKSGHTLNNQLLRQMFLQPESFEIVTIYDDISPPIAYS